MTIPFPEPTESADSRTEVLVRYLDHYRAVVLAKVDGLTEEQLRGSALPSGWSPLELVKHLTFVELRWLEWGFEGAQVADRWGDQEGERWHVGDDEATAEVLAALQARGRVTAAIARRHSLEEVGAAGERWDGAPPATLERCLLHVMQEYARHLGHLDVVRELLDGSTGES
jgi:hypothetical protein